MEKLHSEYETGTFCVELAILSLHCASLQRNKVYRVCWVRGSNGGKTPYIECMDRGVLQLSPTPLFRFTTHLKNAPKQLKFKIEEYLSPKDTEKPARVYVVQYNLQNAHPRAQRPTHPNVAELRFYMGASDAVLRFYCLLYREKHGRPPQRLFTDSGNGVETQRNQGSRSPISPEQELPQTNYNGGRSEGSPNNHVENLSRRLDHLQHAFAELRQEVRGLKSELEVLRGGRAQGPVVLEKMSDLATSQAPFGVTSKKTEVMSGNTATQQSNTKPVVEGRWRSLSFGEPSKSMSSIPSNLSFSSTHTAPPKTSFDLVDADEFKFGSSDESSENGDKPNSRAGSVERMVGSDNTFTIQPAKEIKTSEILATSKSYDTESSKLQQREASDSNINLHEDMFSSLASLAVNVQSVSRTSKPNSEGDQAPTVGKSSSGLSKQNGTEQKSPQDWARFLDSV